MNSLKNIVLAITISIFTFVCTQISFSKTISPMDQGLELYKQGKYEIALVFFEKAFQENPLNSELYFYMGNIYNNKKMFDESITAYKRGLDLASDDNKSKYLYNLAKTYQSAQRFEDALKAYDQVGEISNDYPEIYLYQGMIHYQLKNKDEAIKAFESYLVKDPKSPQKENVKIAINTLKDKNFKWQDELEEKPKEEKEDLQVIYIISDKKEEVSKSEQDENIKLVEDKGVSEEGEDKKISDEEAKKKEDKLASDLKKKEEEEANKGVDESAQNLKVDSENIKVKEQEKKEGKDFDEVER